jgi:transcriptional regulator with XRE-family HTH domain
MLKSWRESLGMTLARTARRAGTSTATLCRYESGWTRFEIGTLRKLATSLGCRLRIELVPISPPRKSSSERGVRRLKRLFWDKPFVPEDLKQYPRWVAARVLEYGEISDVRFLAEVMGTDTLLELSGAIRFSSRKAVRFWERLRELEGIPCMRKHSPPAAESFWAP